jgi:hypothetical protein
MAQNSKTRYWSKDQYDSLFFSLAERALLLQVRPIGAGWMRRIFTSLTNKRGSRGVSALWKKPKRPVLNGDGSQVVDRLRRRRGGRRQALAEAADPDDGRRIPNAPACRAMNRRRRMLGFGRESFDFWRNPFDFWRNPNGSQRNPFDF